MMLGLGKKKPGFIVMDAQTQDHSAIADLHASSFARGWTGAELAKLATQNTCHLLVAKTIGEPNAPLAGFNIYRQTLQEAEILSIAVDAKLRRSGLGEQLMRETILRLAADRVETLFLEVDSNNLSAVAMYNKLGFEVVGNRPGYYKKSSGDGIMDQNPATALVMQLKLVA